MPIQTATNPTTGERIAFINGQWVPYTQSATNDAGQKAFLVGSQWMYEPAPEPAPEPEKGFFSNIGNLLVEGGKQAIGAAKVAPSVTAGTVGQEQAATIAEEAARKPKVMPKELQETLGAFKDESKQYEEAKGGWETAKALGNFALEFGKQALTNPKGAAYMTAQSAANMAPSIAGMIVGGKAGAVAGSPLGPGGAAVGAVIGGVGGGFAGQAPMEIGAEFIDRVKDGLQERGLEPTEENVRALLSDKAFVDKAVGEARTKGLTTAAVDSLMTVGAGKFAAAPRRAAIKAAQQELGVTAKAADVAKRADEILKQGTMAQRAGRAVGRGAGAVGIDVAGGGLSEAAGQYAAYGKVDPESVALEMLGELGGSMIEVPGAAYATTRDLVRKKEEPAAAPQDQIKKAVQTAAQAPQAPQAPERSLEDLEREAGLTTAPEEPAAKVETLPPQAPKAKESPFPTWDTIGPKSSVTLYRGEGQDQIPGGDWWTTDRDKAARYGKVREVTLTGEELGRRAARGHGGADEFFFPGGIFGNTPSTPAPTLTPPAAEAPKAPEQDFGRSFLAATPESRAALETAEKSGPVRARVAIGEAADAITRLADTIKNAGYSNLQTLAQDGAPAALIALKEQMDKISGNVSRLVAGANASIQGTKSPEFGRISEEVIKDVDDAIRMTSDFENLPPAAQEMEGVAAPGVAEIEQEVEQLTKEQEALIAERTNLEQRTQGTSLVQALRSTLNDGEMSELAGRARQIGKNPFINLKAPKGKTGASMEDMVNSGKLDIFLPYDMRTDSPSHDNAEAAEYIREKLRNNQYYTYDTEQEIGKLNVGIQTLEDRIAELLSIEEINREIQRAIQEQRELDEAAAEFAAESPAGAAPERKAQEAEATVTEPPATPEDEGLKLESPTKGDVIEQEERKAKAAEQDEKDQIRKESEAGAGQFKLTQEEGRQDTTGGLFDQPQEAEQAPEEPAIPEVTTEEEIKQAMTLLDTLLSKVVPPFKGKTASRTITLKPKELTTQQKYLVRWMIERAITLGMPPALVGNITSTGATGMDCIAAITNPTGWFLLGKSWAKVDILKQLQTVLHEFGHSVDYAHSSMLSHNPKWAPCYAELEAWYNSDPKRSALGYPFSPMFRGKVRLKEESFAQAFSFYFTRPLDLQKNAPQSYSEINSIVERIRDESRKARAAGQAKTGTAGIQIYPAATGRSEEVRPGDGAVVPDIGRAGAVKPEADQGLITDEQTRSANFKRWFGDSKVVDADGNPLVVYHGTKADISAFEGNRATEKDAGWYGRGIYFTADPNTASAYSGFEEMQGKDAKSGANVIPVYLSLQNPYVWPKGRPAATTRSEADAIRAELEAAGYDGVIVPNEYAEPAYAGYYEVIAFRPEQIKSAVGNRGTFSPESPDILNIEDSAGSAAGMFNSEQIEKNRAPAYKGREKLIEMSIEDFLRLAEEGKYDPKLENTKKLIKEGKPFSSLPYLLVESDGKVYGHEGRHRAMALKDAGYTTMPVLLRSANIRWSEQSDPDRFDYVEDWPKKLTAQDGAQNKNFSIPFPVSREDADSEYTGDQGGIEILDNQEEPKSNVPRRNIYGDLIDKKTWEGIADSKLFGKYGKDDLIRALQDKYIDLKRVQTAIKDASREIGDKWDAYVKEELFHGRTAKRTQDFINKELDPVLEEMKKNDVSIGEMEQYLHNRHAEEYNKQVAKVNPNDPEMQDGGSGINTEDARKYLANIPEDRRKVYESIAAKIDSITKGTRELLVESGLEKAKTIKAWEKAFPFYVPLQREDIDFQYTSNSTGTGRGFDQRGSFSRRAMGSKRNVVDILANIAMQRERAIVKSEKNRVSQAVYGLAIQNPNPDFWMAVNPAASRIPASAAEEMVALGIDPDDAQYLMQEPTQRALDKKRNEVINRVNTVLRGNSNVLATRVNGEDRYVFFNNNDERAKNMVSALKNLDADSLMAGLGLFAKATRYLASVNTQYNPFFGAYNFLRDTQGAALQLSTTPIAGKQKEVIKGAMPALFAIYKDLRRERKKATPEQNEWAKLWQEFQSEGGQTGFRDTFSRSQDRSEAIQKQLSRINENNAASKARAVFDWLSDYNDAMENAVRLSAYKVALDQGMTKQQAASVAKNLTVNFNRKGTASTTIGALWAFFNAAMQGTTRLVQTLRGPAGRKIIAGGLLLGAAQAIAMALAGYEEDEPPDFVKERNLLFPIFGTDNYIMLPMPLGYHVIPSTGRMFTEAAMAAMGLTKSRKGASERMTDLMGMYMSAFNPIGNAGWSAQTFAPTLLDPWAALDANKDWTGKRIYREDFSKLDPTPGFTRAKDAASLWSTKLAEFFNYASGGTEFRPGTFSPTPDQIDYLIGVATGGIGREITKLGASTKGAAEGEEVPLYKVPVVGRFVGETKGAQVEANRFYRNIEHLNKLENEIKGRASKGGNVSEVFKENPEAALYKTANKIYEDIKKLKTKRDALKERGVEKGPILALNKAIEQKMKALNDAVDRLEK